jgi:hypothetical protein
VFRGFRLNTVWEAEGMNPRVASFVLVLALPLSLGACSDVQDTASSAASDAASQGASKVAEAAKNEVRLQICQRVADGKVSAEDKQVLSGLVSRAASAGVPGEITTPLRQIADSGDKAPAEAVRTLKQACASPAPTG